MTAKLWSEAHARPRSTDDRDTIFAWLRWRIALLDQNSMLNSGNLEVVLIYAAASPNAFIQNQPGRASILRNPNRAFLKAAVAK
jgi:hypothetical protein